MPKHKNYTQDENISDNDIVLGSDADDNLKTKNYKIGKLKDYFLSFVEGVVGPQGPQGIQGETGPQGPPGESASVNYKVYTALLTQKGTDAPVATVLENTLGFTPIYTYSSAGVYILSPLEDFYKFLSKGVVIFLNKGSNDSTNATNSISCAYNYKDGVLEIRTYANGLASDDILSDVYSFQKTSFEIRVYN